MISTYSFGFRDNDLPTYQRNVKKRAMTYVATKIRNNKVIRDKNPRQANMRIRGVRRTLRV